MDQHGPVWVGKGTWKGDSDQDPKLECKAGEPGVVGKYRDKTVQGHLERHIGAG